MLRVCQDGQIGESSARQKAEDKDDGNFPRNTDITKRARKLHCEALDNKNRKNEKSEKRKADIAPRRLKNRKRKEFKMHNV